MYFFSINTITSVKAYRDLTEGINYIEIKYSDLDGNANSIIYGKKNQYSDSSNNETMNKFTMEFATTMSLLYDTFDYNDLRNDLFKILYRFNFEYNRRSYFKSILVDKNFKNYLTVNLGEFEQSKWLQTTHNNITKIRNTSDNYYGYDSDGNVVALDSSKTALLAYYKLKFPDMLFDNTKHMQQSTVSYNNLPQFEDYTAQIKVPQIYIYLTKISADIINTIISKTSSNNDQVTNVVIDIAVSDLSDDIRAKIKTDLSAVNNLRIYLMVDSEDMSKDLSTVTNEIVDIYTIFENTVDGIYLKNIKTFDTTNGSDSDRKTYDNYYMKIKTFAHDAISKIDGKAFRYYIIGRMTAGNVVPEYMYGKYNNPIDQIISYIGDTPAQAGQLGDSKYQDYKIAIITNKDLTQLNAKDQDTYLNSITKFCTGVYVTDQSDFDTLSNSIDDQQQYCEQFVDSYKSIYYTGL